MTYDATLATTRDRIRFIVGDTSNDADAEYFPDATYDAEIANYDAWKLAAASMAEAAAVKIESDPSSINLDGDLVASWQDRTRSLRAKAVQLRAEAAAEALASGTGITSVALDRDGGSTGEYRTDRFRYLVR